MCCFLHFYITFSVCHLCIYCGLCLCLTVKLGLGNVHMEIKEGHCILLSHPAHYSFEIESLPEHETQVI